MQLPQSKKKKKKKAPEMTGGVSLSIYTETLGLQARPIFRWPAQMTAPSAKNSMYKEHRRNMYERKKKTCTF